MTAILSAFRRPVVILAFLLAGCVTALSVQARRPTGKTVAEDWLLGMVGFVHQGVNVIRDASDSVALRFRTRVSLQAENLKLKVHLAELEAELLKLKGAEEENKKILEKMGSSPPLPFQTEPARILTLQTSGPFRSALLDRGQDAGLEPGGIVVGVKGLIGRVVAVGLKTARVQLISDRLAAVGVVLGRTGRSGVTRGDASGRVFVQYVPTIADVVAGESVVTSGTDGIYPKDIPVGVIEAVRGAGASIFLDLPVTLSSDPQAESLVFVLPPLPPSNSLETGPPAGPEAPAGKGMAP